MTFEPPDTFSTWLTDPYEVGAMIHDINSSKATGENEIPISLPKYFPKNLTHPLAHIINASFLTGVFPEKLKRTISKPVHKKGDRIQFNNYRPTALTSNIYNRKYNLCQNDGIFKQA